jgi:cytosine/adenosine deaminase-related metal-dependent hydrolase
MVQPLHIRGAYVMEWDDQHRYDLYTNSRVLDKPANDAIRIDLAGYTIFPGLINAHDHLELNHYPRSKFRDKYDNAHQWGEDMNARLDTEPYKSLRAYPLADRLFIGGLKNLLCGATTVAHHNPPHKELFRKDFPVRVLRKYGWAHSLHFSTDEEVVRSYQSTPKDVPWFIHLAEGTDDIAAGEYKRLKALGCVGENTIIVHAVGMTDEDIDDAASSIRGVVFCPSTNKYLLGKTADIDRWLNLPNQTFHVALGSDSRLTADGDLMDEVHSVDESSRYMSSAVRYSLSASGAEMLFDKSAGRLITGSFADLVVLTETSAYMDDKFRDSRRSDFALVVKGGVPQIGNPDVMAKFPHIQTVPATLDGVPKRIHVDLARRIWKCSLKERGLELDEPPKVFRLFQRKVAKEAKE